MKPDELEESRLRGNIHYWKDKYDLLLCEKKELLIDQSANHRAIRELEQQVEELRLAMKHRESYLDCLQDGKKTSFIYLEGMNNNTEDRESS